jgi:hypothetical protein
MPRITNPNIEILELAANQLDDLVARVVFLGGCATGLLLTDPREVEGSRGRSSDYKLLAAGVFS